jgi:hypothetical protein
MKSRSPSGCSIWTRIIYAVQLAFLANLLLSSVNLAGYTFQSCLILENCLSSKQRLSQHGIGSVRQFGFARMWDKFQTQLCKRFVWEVK